MRWVSGGSWFLCASMLAACSSESPQASDVGTGGTGPVDSGPGSGGATQVPVTSLASMRQTLAGSGVIAHVVFTDLADACEAYVEKRRKNADLAGYSETVLEFGLNSGSELKAARYDITHRWGREAPQTGSFATAAMSTTDAACKASRASSTAGFIQINGVEASRLIGKFSIQFDDGTQLTGDFDAPDCPAYGEAAPHPDAPAEPQCLPSGED